MPDRRRSPLRAPVSGLLGLCLVAAGCQETPLNRVFYRPEAYPAIPMAQLGSARALPVIAPHTVVQWSVESAETQRGVKGKSVVGPDGNMSLGPYGSVPVAGLTMNQAKAALVRHVVSDNHVKDPRVTLTALAIPASGSPDTDLAQESNKTQNSNLIARTGLQAPPRLVPVPAGSSLNDRSQTSAYWPDTQAIKEEPPLGQDVETLPQPRKLANGQAMAPSVALHGAGFAGPPAPTELRKESLPPYIIEPPDILLVESSTKAGLLKYDQPLRGQHLVRPDGTISLGIYGSVYVAGMTLEQAKEVIAEKIKERVKDFDLGTLHVDVLAYNSKVYYVVTDGGGYGEQVYRIPITGSETVLDALALVNGLPPVASKKHIWVARRTPGDVGYDQVLPVDWIGITQRGAAATNYQVLPGDRIYVKADRWRTLDATVGKILSPFERVLGITLLGSSTVNSIEGRGLSATGR